MTAKFKLVHIATIKICLEEPYNNHWRLCLYGFLQHHHLQFSPPISASRGAIASLRFLLPKKLKQKSSVKETRKA